MVWTSSSSESLTHPPALRTSLCLFLCLSSYWCAQSHDDCGQGDGRGSPGFDVRPTWAPPMPVHCILGEILNIRYMARNQHLQGPNCGCCYGYPRLYRILLLLVPIITQEAKLCHFQLSCCIPLILASYFLGQCSSNCLSEG